MKWILSGALLALACALFFFQRYSAKTEYVNGLAAYTDLPGREYIFERDCYIFKFKDHDTAWPLVGSHLTVPALPETVTPKSVGADLPNIRILDVARTGDRFRIVSVRRERSQVSTTVTFEILFVDEARRKYPRLDAYWILDHSPEANGAAPGILATYAVSARTD